MKKGLLFMFLMVGILAVAPVLAEGIGESLRQVWEGEDGKGGILGVGSLTFLLGNEADNKLIGFVRIAIGVAIFSLLYFGLIMIPGMSKNIAITLGVIFAIIPAVFMPASVLTMFGETWAAVFAFLFIGIPLVGIGALLFATPTPGRLVALLKFIGVCFLIWLFNEIGKWASVLVNARPVY